MGWPKMTLGIANCVGGWVPSPHSVRPTLTPLNATLPLMAGPTYLQGALMPLTGGGHWQETRNKNDRNNNGFMVVLWVGEVFMGVRHQVRKSGRGLAGLWVTGRKAGL